MIPAQVFNTTSSSAVIGSWQPLLAQFETKMGKISLSKHMAESSAESFSGGSCLHEEIINPDNKNMKAAANPKINLILILRYKFNQETVTIALLNTNFVKTHFQ
jgi:hypothetical protein